MGGDEHRLCAFSVDSKRLASILQHRDQATGTCQKSLHTATQVSDVELPGASRKDGSGCRRP